MLPPHASIFLALLIIALVLTGCELPIANLQPPTPIPSPSAAQPTASATATDIPTQTPTPMGPPTEAPPELGEPVELPALTAGATAVIQRIAMQNETDGWAVGGIHEDDGRILVTGDGGRSWQERTPPTVFAEGGATLRTAAAFLGMEHAWVVRFTPVEGEPAAVPLIVWRTANGGASWQPSQPIRVPFIGSQYADPYLTFSTPEDGWLLGRIGGAGMHQYPVALYSTHDGGETWQILTQPFGTDDAGLMSCHKSGMAFVGADTGLLTIDSCPITGAEVRITKDGGQTWTPITLPEPPTHPGIYDSGSCESHSPIAFDSGVIKLGVLCRIFDASVGDLSFLYSTADAGASWTTVESVPGTLTFLSPETVWATDHELYRSMDAGMTWDQVKVVAWQGQFSFVSSELGWAVARSESEIALVKTTNGGRTWSLIEPTIAN